MHFEFFPLVAAKGLFSRGPTGLHACQQISAVCHPQCQAWGTLGSPSSHSPSRPALPPVGIGKGAAAQESGGERCQQDPGAMGSLNTRGLPTGQGRG